jgi:alpha-methylacyl-CoA racemase
MSKTKASETKASASGPLVGIKVIEIAGKGPGPYCGMLLSDMGADVIRIDRPAPTGRRFEQFQDPMSRGRRSLAVDLKNPAGIETVLRLCQQADALIEGFRPGVIERLGLGPKDCQSRNPKLVYGRVTGWGQDGPLAQAAGHDLNYVALSGTLHALGDADRPPPAPLALIADFGGGGMFLALGVVSALLEAKNSGLGQVVDAAMIEGVASLTTFTHGLKAAGWWQDDRQSNMLDGGAHFYSTYETKDGKYISLAPIEPEFYRQMVQLLELDETDMPKRMDRAGWPKWKETLRAKFLQKTRDQWCAELEGSDICFAPVLSFDEAPHHPQNQARGTFIERDGVRQPAPSPRFSRTPSAIQNGPPSPGQHSGEILQDWGFSATDIEDLMATSAIHETTT